MFWQATVAGTGPTSWPWCGASFDISHAADSCHPAPPEVARASFQTIPSVKFDAERLSEPIGPFSRSGRFLNNPPLIGLHLVVKRNLGGEFAVRFFAQPYCIAIGLEHQMQDDVSSV